MGTEPDIEQRIRHLAIGPEVEDIAAAANCRCACHPQPASADLHNGGTTCPCQLSAEQRADARTKAVGTLLEFLESELGGSLAGFDAQVADECRHVATEMGFTLIDAGGLAPFVARGVIDGRFFYLRERHDQWRVCVAGDEHPLADVWSNHELDEIEIANGDASGFIDQDGRWQPGAMVRHAAETVRLWVARRTCEHLRVDEHQWCPRCGVRL